MKALRLLAALCIAALPVLAAAGPELPGVQQWPLRPPPEHPADVDDDFADLAPFGEKLAAAQVVALGEQSHGSSEEFRYRLRLVRYLHEKLGFDVLLLESGFYDMGRLSHAVMSRGRQLDEQAPGNVFYMYANSAEGRELLRYIQKQRLTPNRLAFAGIDSQHTGNLARTELLSDLRTALEPAAPELLKDETAWAAYKQRVLALVALDRQAPESTEQATFLAYNRRLQDALCGDRASPVTLGSPAWWCRVTASLEAQARSLWSQDRDYQRDNAMGANAIWLVDQLFKGRKVIIWAHTIHIAKGLQRDAEHLQAGEVMYREWANRYQVVNFTTTTGSYLDFIDMKPKTLQPPPAGSLEARLPAGQTLLLRAVDKPLPLPQYGIDYRVDAWPVAMQLGRNWDWLIALPQVTPVQMTR